METTETTESFTRRTYCDCGATMSHVIYEEVPGWLCDDPSCGNFIPDPMVSDAGVSANGTA